MQRFGPGGNDAVFESKIERELELGRLDSRANVGVSGPIAARKAPTESNRQALKVSVQSPKARERAAISSIA